jgi:membrane protein
MGGGESLFWQAVNFLISLGVLTLLFAMFFRWFPDGPVDWDDAWRGGLVTAALFNIRKLAIAWYIGTQVPRIHLRRGSVGRRAPHLGHYSAQIVLFGGEITHVCAQQKQPKARPG